MAKVFFFDYSEERGIFSGMRRLLEESGVLNIIPKGSIAVKLHMGELGCVTYLRPVLVRCVVNIIKKAGGKPFVTDTTALYPGERDTVEKYLKTAEFNGFASLTIGAPIVIADDDGGVALPILNTVEGCRLREIEVAARIYQADFLLVLSHVKGHMLAGFGGAIKNVAMGCVTKESKRAQHFVNSPAFDESKCDGCGICVEKCPTGALKLEGGKLRRDEEKCQHCSHCMFECPTGAWFWRKGFKEDFQVYVAHAAAAVLSQFRGRVGFLNFVQDVTPHCDCATPSGLPIVQDVGILASLDPVAIDKASLDLIDKATPLVTSLKPPDVLGKLHDTDSLVQLRVAERLKLGSLDYELIRV